MEHGPARRRAFALACALGAATILGACSQSGRATVTASEPIATAAIVPTDAPTSTTAPSSPSTTVPSTTTATSAAPPTTTSPTTTSPSTAVPTATSVTPGSQLPQSPYPNVEVAMFLLALDSVAVSVSVLRDGVAPWGLAAGQRVDGEPVTSDTPFVSASVSKLVTALSIARLVADGRLSTDAVVPWEALGLVTDPLWGDVTVRELLDHTSGMPSNQKSWLDDPGPCSIPLQEAVLLPPTDTRGEWRYSNGNYCALGMVVETVTGRSLDEAAYDLVFTPAGVTGPYLSTDGMRSDSAPSPRGIARLARLGGAGSWLASTDDIVTMLDSVTDADLQVMQWPGIILDQYGWGHTGTVDGAKACAWVLEGGRTKVAAIVSGPRPSTGGKVCDAVLPALAADLGLWAGEPVRTP